MPQYGLGSGTAITPGAVTGVTGSGTCAAISLVRYAQRIGYRECAFFGIRHPDNDQWECRAIWTKSQRDMIEWALLEAQSEIEQEIGYPLVPCWVAGERHVYRQPLLTRWGHVIEPGVRSDTMLLADAPVSYLADPATVGPIGLGSCDQADVHLFLPDTDIEIVPESVSVIGGNVTFSIPWCRMAAEDYLDNPAEGLNYADVATWGAAVVDVRCITTDPSTQATLIIAPSTTCSTAPCTPTEYDACLYVRQPEIGSLEVHRADYAAGVWTRKTLCYCPSWVAINYRAGLLALTRQAEDTIIRLAHSKMPHEMCGCDATTLLWRRDTHVPEVLTRERINCNFGLSDGAWWAYRQAQAMRLLRGSVL